jgi:uncharacterized protein
MLNLSSALFLPILAAVLLSSCSTFAQTPVKIDVPKPVTTNTSSPSASESANASSSAMGQSQTLPNTKKLVIGKRTILLEEANSPQEQAIGLMNRRSMPIDHGMLFNFEPATPAQFWMKNTLIPLDIIFIYKGEIKNIQFNVPPCKADPCPSYGPNNTVLIDRVLELNAGQAQVLGLKEGSRLEFLPVQPQSSAKPTAPVRKKG